MTTAGPFDPDDLMRHEAFVRELARRLVRDAQAAEDVAQQTWLAVLQAPVRPLRSVRAWLATIVRRTAHKRTGSERSRRRREEAAAPPEPAPSAAEIVEREQARAAVVQALLALPAHYRDVVVLRWFEGLPPRDVARRLCVPVETVRTRHRRAMEQLRNELDRRAGGDRAAWAAMLLPLARPDGVPLPVTATASTTTILTGALLMSTKLKLMTAVALALAVTAWLSWPPAARPPQAGESGHAVTHATVATTPAEQQRGGALPIADDADESAASPVERELAVEAPTTGAVEVHVTWAADGTPAADVTVIVRGQDARELLTTDAGGTVRLPELAPGRYLTNIMRPDVMWFEPELQQPRFDVTAGVTTEIDLVVPESLELHGVVVDGNDRPVAGAEIVMGGGYSALVMARTDDAGRFAVRDVATRCEVGARAPGLAPTPLRDVQGSKGGSIELRFVLDQRGASVEGTVLGPDAHPVAGARVMVGSHDFVPVRFADGTWGKGPPRSVEHTDEQGRFALPSVTPGTVPIAVVAPGLAPHHGELVLAPGSSRNITVHLLPGVTVRGVVRSTRGAAVAKARVTTSRGTDLARWAQTAADGSYEIVGAATGELTIEVESDAFDSQSMTLHATAGQTLSWNPQLVTPGIVLRGRVLAADDRPVADARVAASRSQRQTGFWSRFARTDAEGRFELPNCEPGVPLYLEARADDGRSEARLAAVLPEAGEHVMRLPAPSAVYMRGIVLGDDGKPLPNVAVWAADHHGSRRTTNDIATGAFALGPYPAGAYKIWIRADGCLPFDTDYRTLADGETWDVGEVRLQRAGEGGTLRVALIGDQNLDGHYLTIQTADGSYRESCQIADGMALAGPLRPGEHYLQLAGPDVAPEVVVFRIREGRETRLDVPLRRGTPVTLQFEAHADAVLPVCVQLRLTTADGAPVLRRDVWQQEGQGLALRTMLLPGRYRVEATTAEHEVPARVGSVEFEVAGEPVTQRVGLAPRD